MTDEEKEAMEILQQKRYATMSSARLEGESFDEYKDRRKTTNEMVKFHLKGKRIK